MKIYSVYILECSDKSFYVGLSNDLSRRIEEHKFGLNKKCYTYRKRPVKLIYFEEFNDVYQAISREKQIKGWGRVKKMALISGNYDHLPKLAERKT